jgi:hypothetical protein
LLGAEMSVVPLSMLVYGFLIGQGGLRAGLVMFALGNLLLGAFANRESPGPYARTSFDPVRDAF